MRFSIVLALATLALAAPTQKRQTASVEVPGTSSKTVDAPAVKGPSVDPPGVSIPKNVEVDGPLSDPIVKRQKVKVGAPEDTTPDEVDPAPINGPTVDPPPVTAGGTKGTTVTVGGPVP